MINYIAEGIIMVIGMDVTNAWERWITIDKDREKFVVAHWFCSQRMEVPRILKPEESGNLTIKGAAGIDEWDNLHLYQFVKGESKTWIWETSGEIVRGGGILAP